MTDDERSDERSSAHSASIGSSVERERGATVGEEILSGVHTAFEDVHLTRLHA